MGTTLTAMQTQSGLTLWRFLLVEGYENAVTEGPTAACVTALAGTEWTSAIGGLTVVGSVRQELVPWDPTVRAATMTFGVESDALGLQVFGTGAGNWSYLAQTLDSTADVVHVQSTAGFASSGTIYVGTEAITYTRLTSTTFEGCTRGRWCPFKANTETARRFGRRHQCPVFNDHHGILPKVSDRPRWWVGRQVALYGARVVGGVMDTLAQAECLFAGRVAAVREDANGVVVLECEDARAVLRDKMLFSEQWSARLVEGVNLKRGWRFSAKDIKAAVEKDADDLVVVGTGSASGANEIEEGRYTVDELADVLNLWLASELGAARLNFSCHVSPRHTSGADGTLRWRFHWALGSTTDANFVSFKVPNQKVANFIGWHGVHKLVDGDFFLFSGSTYSIDSPETPYRVMADSADIVQVEDAAGRWIDNQAYAWPSAMGLPDGCGLFFDKFCVLQLGSDGPVGVFELYAGSFESPTHLYRWPAPSLLTRMGATTMNGAYQSMAEDLTRIRIDVDGDLRLRQVLVMAGGLLALVTKMLASTGTTGYNHASYDVLPAQLGCAVPWGLLGSTWTQSLATLDADHDQGMYVVLDKPTRLTDVLGCELVARVSGIVMRSGTLRVATWGTPTAGPATFNLTEDNKGAPVDARDDQVTTVDETDDGMVNVIKLRWNRDFSGQSYKDECNVYHVASIAELGREKVITIDMRNTFGASSASSSDIEDIKSGLVGAIQMFAYPLRVLTRTVDSSLYAGISPGEFGTISDDFARDPSTGERSLAAKPCLLVEHQVDWGGHGQPMLGTAKVYLLPGDAVATYSPAAEFDFSGAANGGYDAGTATITCVAHQHSEAGETHDAAYFPAGSKIRVVQIDPDDPANPLTWTRTVLSQTGDTITLTSGLSSPTYDGSLYYRVVPDHYGACTAAQQVKVFQADDGDGTVEDARAAYAYGHAPQQAESLTWTSADPVNEPARLYAQVAYGDPATAAPLDVGYEQDTCRLVNNLVRYRTMTNQPFPYRSTVSSRGGVIRWVPEVRPVFFGPGDLGPGNRLVAMSPLFRRATAGALRRVFATLCRHAPIGYGFATTDADDPQYTLVGPIGPTLEWSTTSTGWTHGEMKFTTMGVADPLTGIAYLVVEIETDVEYRGMGRLQLLPYQEETI